MSLIIMFRRKGEINTTNLQVLLENARVIDYNVKKGR